MSKKTPVLAFHGQQWLKDDLVNRMRDHRKEDRIIRGTYQELVNYEDPKGPHRGCFIGCTLPYLNQGSGYSGIWHGEVERRYGIPQLIGKVIDLIFEKMHTDDDQHADFAVDVLRAMPVGVDLSLVFSPLVVKVLTDREFGPLSVACNDDEKNRVADLIDLHRRRMAGDEPAKEEWHALVDVALYDESSSGFGDMVIDGRDPEDLATFFQEVYGLNQAEPDDFYTWAGGRLIKALKSLGK